MQIIKGKVANSGYCIGPIFVVRKKTITTKKEKIRKEEVQSELERFITTLEETKKRFQEIISNLSDEDSTTRDIFDALGLILNDPALINKVNKEIEENYCNVEYAVDSVLEDYAIKIGNLPDPYLCQRANDIRDIKNLILEELAGEITSYQNLEKPSIIIAKDLVATDIARLKRENILGMALEKGAMTSHVAIVARSLGIPCLIDCSGLLKHKIEGKQIIIDTDKAALIINPESTYIDEIKEKIDAFEKLKSKFLKISKGNSVTIDGKRIIVAGNAATFEDVEEIIANGGEGVGLFRTELLYTEFSSLPKIEDLTELFSKIAFIAEDFDVIIRTLDAGSDKPVPSIPLEEEPNPFLGVRGIRMTLEHKDLLRSMLKACVKANKKGNLKLMYPMVSQIEEVVQANEILEEIFIETQTDTKPSIGIMIETPSAAILADKFVHYVSFFSIGTNDLTQYVMAADRINPKVERYLSNFEPAVLRLIKKVIDSAHDHGRWVGVCGEMAANPAAVLILIGLGIDELSMNASSIPKIKYLINLLNYEVLNRWVLDLLELDSSEKIQKEAYKKISEYINKSEINYFL